MDSKKELRLKAKEIRKVLPIKDLSLILTQALKKDDYYINAKNVMFYYPKCGEIDLLKILSDDKNFYLPRVNGDNLDICSYKFGDELKKSEFGVFEPVTTSCNPQELDLVIVPALMADLQGYRLGYGCGYYDRFLNLYRKYFKTITLLARELMTEKLPTDDFDIKIDKIIFK